MTCSVEQVCQSFGVSRQAYYKRQKRSVNNYIEKQVILDAVREIRRKQPRIGVRKLHRMLSPRFQEKGITSDFSAVWLAGAVSRNHDEVHGFLISSKNPRHLYAGHFAIEV